MGGVSVANLKEGARGMCAVMHFVRGGMRLWAHAHMLKGMTYDDDARR